MPLLWVLRDVLGLTGTKYGCGMAQCGACTVHLDGQAARSCVLPASARCGQAGHDDRGPVAGRAHPVQHAWIEADVVQCGYCQPGQIMAAVRAAQGAAEADRRGHRRRAVREPLPLRHVPAHPRRRAPRRRAAGERPMSAVDAAAVAGSSRRAAGAAAALAIGFHVPTGPAPRSAQEPPPAERRCRPRTRSCASAPDDSRDRDPRARRDGPGHLDGARDAGRRGARPRLDEGPLRARAGGAAYAHTAYRHPDDRRVDERRGPSSTATARWARRRATMLIAAAAAQWKVAPATCRARERRRDPRRPSALAYGELAAEAAATSPPPRRSTLKAPARLEASSASPTRRLDTPEKVTGTAQFGIDVQFPGLHTALVARPPVFGGTVKSLRRRRRRRRSPA